MKSIRRNPVLSAVMVVSLAIGMAVWVAARAGLEGARRNPLPRQTSLYEVRVEQPPQWSDVLTGVRYRDLEKFAMQYVSHPEAEALLKCAPGARRSMAVDSQVVVAAPDGRLVAAPATLSSRDLFRLFELDITRGAPWSAAADAGAANELVIDEDLAVRLFGTGEVVGKTLPVNGVPFTITGTLRHSRKKTYLSGWLRSRVTDEIYLPFAALWPLGLRPQSSFRDRGTASADLRSSADRWLFLWIELPDAASRERFAADAAALGLRAHLVSFAEAYKVINYVHPAYELLYLFSQIALVASALNLLRLLVAKFNARVAEAGIHRAMGASRGTIVAQHVIEATFIGVAGGALGLLIGVVDVAFMNSVIPDRPGDGAVDGFAVVVTLGLATLIGMIAGCYSAWRATRLPPALFLRQA